MLLSQTLPGLVEPSADAVFPPAGAALSDLRPPPTPFEVASTITVARMKMQAAADKSFAALPKMPWTERGLADVEIKREQIRFDEKRGKYVTQAATCGSAVRFNPVQISDGTVMMWYKEFAPGDGNPTQLLVPLANQGTQGSTKVGTDSTVARTALMDFGWDLSLVGGNGLALGRIGPAHWGGYRLTPDWIEFWQGRSNRLHDRFRYKKISTSEWLIERLSP
jgi:hypothetical protein